VEEDRGPDPRFGVRAQGPDLVPVEAAVLVGADGRLWEDQAMKLAYSGRDLRQVALMEDRVAGFRAGGVALARLVNDLDSLWNELETTAAWVDDLRSHWWTLEQVYAVAIDRDELDALPAEMQQLVDEAVAAIALLLGKVERDADGDGDADDPPRRPDTDVRTGTTTG